jgi:hypothetical protein
MRAVFSALRARIPHATAHPLAAKMAPPGAAGNASAAFGCGIQPARVLSWMHDALPDLVGRPIFSLNGR